jgi:class 3 adenylate cyclase/predicted ATPase
MDLYAVLDQVLDLLRARGRLSYPALQQHFGLDDDQLNALRAELLYTQADRISEDGRGLVWHAERPSPADAERRQLTVLFCDLIDSTPLSRELDPEDLREVMRGYYETCGRVIERFDGHIAQYLGDGLLVFFGYPRAHEDDAPRAVRAGLKMIEAIAGLSAEIHVRYGVELAVRLGCHTGLVVVGEVVGEGRHELMAMGDTPNIAARLQAIAEPNTLVIGPLTHQLVGGFFDCRPLGSPPLKGVATPLEVHAVLRESNIRSRLDAATGKTGFTPLVGRACELDVLFDGWTQASTGDGRVILVTGEAGIGKSRLVHALTEHLVEHQAWLTACQGSSYHQDTAFYPFVDLFNRVVLRSEPPGSANDKLHKLERFFARSGLPLDDALPGLCSLLSIPVDTAPRLPPDQQKKQSMQALLTILRRRAKQRPVLFIVEDLHWVDPTTVEFLRLLADNIHDARILMLLTSRPDFGNPWTGHPAVSEVTLNRLPPDESVELIHRVAKGSALPPEIVADVVAKTDGVPLFIEELTKTLLESGLLELQADGYELARPLPPLAIPNTLHDSLMARLDRLSTTKALAQLGAAIGREFSYALLRDVSPWHEDVLQNGLEQLVAAEFLYQQGTPPQATYRFKHALIRDAAYQSLLKSTRHQHHQRIAVTIESAFPETVDTQPELLAHHYAAAGLAAQAVPYWRAAAEHALARHANREAANHAQRGLELLATLPGTPSSAPDELAFQMVLGPALSYVVGPQSVGHVHARIYDLARALGNNDALFPALSGLIHAKIVRGEMRAARASADEYLKLALKQDDLLVLAAGHSMLAYAAWWQGDVTETLAHSRRSLGVYDPAQHLAGVAAYNQNPAIVSGYLYALARWVLGFPAQATEAMELTLAHARELQHPNSIGIVLLFSAQLAQLRREPQLARSRADETLAVAEEHGLPAMGLWALLPRGWALTQLDDTTGGIADICAGMDRRRAFKMGAVWPWFLALVADAYGTNGEFAKGFSALDEALQWVQKNDERLYAAEVHRIRGELLLSQPIPQPEEAECCFRRALTAARDQEAKSWELRAATSMARMWRDQGRRDDARELLAPVFGWFTEGFDTRDLQEAKALLSQLAR